MTKLKLCNVHKLAIANEGEGRKPIHIPFGTWAYDDRIDQTLDREHADAIAADLAGKIAAGEPGIPVYQGHPDVPEYAGKYPDKGALGWVKKILVNENGMDLEVEWDRDPGKGFGWFSPYWTGDAKVSVRFAVRREQLSDSTAHAILCIVRELAVNAARHGKARNIKIAGSLGNDGIKLSVADDGCGFDPAARPGPAEGHFGLQGAKERLSAIGGAMHIESSPGNGTKVTVEIGK